MKIGDRVRVLYVEELTAYEYGAEGVIVAPATEENGDDWFVLIDKDEVPRRVAFDLSLVGCRYSYNESNLELVE